MDNYFEDLNQQGIEETEMTIQDLQRLYIDGRITTDQFNRILMDNLGTSEFMKLFGSLMEKAYSKDLLIEPTPKGAEILIHPYKE